MSLWEIRTGLEGESYVRAYAWAADEATACREFARINPGLTIRTIRRLFSSDTQPFCTLANDQGWEHAGQRLARCPAVNRGRQCEEAAGHAGRHRASQGLGRFVW